MLPGFIPRLRALFSSGFHHVSYLIAVIFQMCGLLPRDHVYLVPANFGRFGIRHVMAEAYVRLQFSWKHFDQILIFFTMCTGLVLIALQIFLFGLSIVSGDVMAQAADSNVTSAYDLASWTDWLTLSAAATSNDMALMTLDRVFGVKGIFESCVSTGAECVTPRGREAVAPDAYPTAMHEALHAMLEFYSYGVLMVAVIIILYFVITIVGETAQTGTPFGQRYKHGWVPIRLILFFALLTPLNLGEANAGLNGAQLVTLWTAKYGSNLASNGWGWFGNRLSDEYLGDARPLIAEPEMPVMGPMGQFMFVARACEVGVKLARGREAEKVEPYVIIPAMLTAGGEERFKIRGGDAIPLANADFSDVLEKNLNGNVIIRFGQRSEENGEYVGNVNDECGEITLTVENSKESASRNVQQIHFEFIKSLWENEALKDAATCYMRRNTPFYPDMRCSAGPDKFLKAQLSEAFQTEVEAKLKKELSDQVEEADTKMSKELKEKGWAAGAVWYNRIASMNGAVTTSFFNVPRPSRWPRVMEAVLAQRKAVNASIGGIDRYSPHLGAEREAALARAEDQQIAVALSSAFSAWEKDGGADAGNVPASTGNVILDVVNWVFGFSGLLSIRENEDVHPLATLSSVGRGVMEAVLRNVLVSAGLSGANMAKVFGGDTSTIQNVAKTISGFLFTVATSLLVIGAMLFYVVPLLPFIYFLFAVSGWIKSIFEAMVAMPLWALAHIRIDGEGIPGPAANNGYFLLLEIFLRPLMIVIGLLAGISIFAAMIDVLNDVFDLVISNLAGYDYEQADAQDITFYRGPLDQLMFTIIYAALCYMLALSCFKMIDEIPNQIMRWAGNTTPTFQENAGDPAGQITQQIWKGGTILTTRATGGQLAALTAG